jgi:hypothetical protein
LSCQLVLNRDLIARFPNSSQLRNASRNGKDLSSGISHLG